MKKTLADLFLKIYASQGGIIARWITGAVVSGIVTGLTMLLKKEPSAETIVTITTIVTLAVTTIIGDIVTKVQLNYGVKVQETINDVNRSDLVKPVKVDGRPGPQTQASLEDLTRVANVVTEGMTPKEVKTVKIDMANEKRENPTNKP